MSFQNRSVGVCSDQKFIDVLSGTSGAASSASTGLTAAEFLADLDTALQAITIGADARPYLILPPTVCKTVALLRDSSGPLFPQMTVTGGTIQGIKIVASDAAGDTGFLIDATQVAADPG
jgi:hypothetical protein